jgi:hypothetical protein
LPELLPLCASVLDWVNVPFGSLPRIQVPNESKLRGSPLPLLLPLEGFPGVLVGLGVGLAVGWGVFVAFSVAVAWGVWVGSGVVVAVSVGSGRLGVLVAVGTINSVIGSVVWVGSGVGSVMVGVLAKVASTLESGVGLPITMPRRGVRKKTAVPPPMHKSKSRRTMSHNGRFLFSCGGAASVG